MSQILFAPYTGITIFIRKILGVLIVGAVFFVSGPGFASNEWHLQINDRQNDIVLHYRETASGLTEFRGITHIKSNLSAFVALLRDVEAMPKWVDHAYKVTKLSHISDTEAYTHTITAMPLPFTYRHSIVHSHISQDTLSGDIVISGQDAKPGYLQKLSKEKQALIAHHKKKYVLIRNLKSHWVFRPQADGMVEVEFQGYGNPGGNLSKYIPQRLLRMFIWEGPYNTLKNMRKIVLETKYQSSRFSFIRELTTHKPRQDDSN